MADAGASLTDDVAEVRKLFDALDREWESEPARVRTWHEITERIARIDKVIRHPQAVP
jgi:hypothetical protein